MTPHFLAALVAIALFLLVATAIIRGLSAIAADRRAHHATRHLVGRTYWSPDPAVVHVDPLLARWLATERREVPAAGAASCVAPHPPRGRGSLDDARDRSHLVRRYLAADALMGFLAGMLIAEVADASPRTGTALQAESCGEERAAVKLGRDADARKVPPQAVTATIAELALRPRPAATPEDRRATDDRGTERTVYALRAMIVGYKLEKDHDFHIVIADPHGTTMIVEIPAPSCAAAGAWGQQVGAARAAFVQLLAARHLPPPAEKYRRAHFEATTTGVGFFDKLHGQTGVAGNGVELHPVLAIEAGGGS